MSKLKSKIIFLMAVMLCASSSLYACSENVEKPFDANANLDLENVFYDNFSNGLDSEYWKMGNSQWGGDGVNGGVIPSNVHYVKQADNGIIALQANGEYYTGANKGHNQNHGRKTGATITTRQKFGPGRFEVRLKAMPRFGATTAFWTFAYEKDPNGGLDLNHEIDIELNVNNSFKAFWNTNWITEQDNIHVELESDVVHNDGEWHTYKFEWHTNPNRIDYYIDDVLNYTAFGNIPTIAGHISIGNWFPNGWAGLADFETDYTFVDWFRYTPYLNNDFQARPKSEAQNANLYPTTPIDMPISNLVSNAQFESVLELPVAQFTSSKNAWRLPKSSMKELVTFEENQGVDGSTAIKLTNGASCYQYITGVSQNFELFLSGYAKVLSGSGNITLDFLNDISTKPISSTVLEFDEINEFIQKSNNIKAPNGSTRVKISINADDNSQILFDNLFCNLSKKARPN